MKAELLPDVTGSRAARPRVGFLGVGWIGRHRMQALAQDGTIEVAAIADDAVDAGRAAAEIAPEAALCTLDDMLAMELDAVVIATPSALHAQQSIRALARGLAVFCQKPLARNALETAAVIAAARAHDRLLGVDFSYRYVNGVPQMHELIRSGELGEVFAADLVFHNAYGPDKPWFYDRSLAGGGCLIDLGSHLIDLAHHLLDGIEPTTVSSRLFANGQPATRDQVEDYVAAQLHLDDRVINLACSWRLHAGQDAVIEASFYGTRGAVRLRNVNGSFYDFRVEHLQGTSRRVLAEPPDEWGGRAARAWAQQLARSAAYDPAIESTLAVASIIDRIYQT